MKRIIIGFFALVLMSWPAISHAQYDEDLQHPNQYNDVEDGQPLKLLSYILNPIGVGLEWGVTRPLHYLATQTPAAPILSGDTDRSFFGETNNADRVPPGTFGPYTINPTNRMETVTGQPIVPLLEGKTSKTTREPADKTIGPTEETVPPSPLSERQSQIR
jgi:hypothetical protein